MNTLVTDLIFLLVTTQYITSALLNTANNNSSPMTMMYSHKPAVNMLTTLCYYSRYYQHLHMLTHVYVPFQIPLTCQDMFTGEYVVSSFMQKVEFKRRNHFFSNQCYVNKFLKLKVQVWYFKVTKTLNLFQTVQTHSFMNSLLSMLVQYISDSTSIQFYSN